MQVSAKNKESNIACRLPLGSRHVVGLPSARRRAQTCTMAPRPGPSMVQTRFHSGRSCSHIVDIQALERVWKGELDANAICKPLDTSDEDTRLERVQALAQTQQDARIVLLAMDTRMEDTAKVLVSIKDLPKEANVGIKLGLPPAIAPNADRLHEFGLLQALKSDRVRGYLRSAEAKMHQDIFVAQAKALSRGRAAGRIDSWLVGIEEQEKEAEKEVKGWELDIKGLDAKLELEGLPRSDYLEGGARSVDLGDVSSYVTELSKLAGQHGFEIPPPFEGKTLVQAVKRRILREVDAPAAAMASAVLACLRLLGDAAVHLFSVTTSRHTVRSRPRIMSIVDSGFGTPREKLLERLLTQACAREADMIRGGVLMGQRGVGKSQLVRNLALGKELMRWSLGEDNTYNHAKHHVGIHIASPYSLHGGLQCGSPPALVAAGLYNAGVLPRDPVPDWAVSGRRGFQPNDIAEWVKENGVNALLAIDEAQETYSDPEWRESTDGSVARTKQFWRSLDRCAVNPGFPMTVITGTGQSAATLMYDRPTGAADSSQWKARFPLLWLDYDHQEVEMCLMLTRQQLEDRISEILSLQWAPSYSAKDTALDLDSLTADVGEVLPEDVTLALALTVVRASGCNLESEYVQDAPEKVDSHWVETGQVVHPSLEHVVDGIRADAKGDLESWQGTKAKPGRLTLQAAKEALDDERVLRAAYASRQKVLTKYWQSGTFARGMNNLNREQASATILLRQWHEHMQFNVLGFRQVMLALLECMFEADVNWQKDAFSDPFKPLRPVEVDQVFEKYRAMYIRSAAAGSTAADLTLYNDVQELEAQLNHWRMQQLVVYRSAIEQDGSNTPVSTVGFFGGAFAFETLRQSLTQGLFVTRREFWAIHKQTDGRGVDDFELLVAESLHRNFVSKVLAKGFLPSLPRSAWEQYIYERGFLEEFRPIAVHDRANGFEGGANSIWLKGSDTAKNPGRDELLNRVLKELPDDETGAGLVVILEDDDDYLAETYKYHVIRIHALPGAGGAGMAPIAQSAGLKKFLSGAHTEEFRQLYAGALDVQPEQIVMHRLLVTPNELPPMITKLLPERGYGVHGARDLYTRVSRTSPGYEGALVLELGSDDGVDLSNFEWIDGEDFQEFLFADARVLTARVRASIANTQERRMRWTREAEELAYRISGDMQPQQKFLVKRGEPLNREPWTDEFILRDRWGLFVCYGAPIAVRRYF